ncbi:MAG TPA: hypothetical protein VE567_04245, partial [Sphingomonas sp.]|nr:hypothetical protein [Sphingomonas sp.]
DKREVLANLAHAQPATRQQARWGYARFLIAHGRHAEALGVLDVMLSDDPDLALVNNFQLARGVVLAALNRPAEALGALASDVLAGNPEACFWRAQMFARTKAYDEALEQVGCAQMALRRRPPAARTSFLVTLAEVALAKQRPDVALRWLAMAPDSDPAANIPRGSAYAALGQLAEARIRLGRAQRGGNLPQRYDAQVRLIEIGISQHTVPVGPAERELDRIRFVWRGGPIEERALRVSYALANQTKDPRRALSAAAALIRYFDLGPDLPPLMARVQAQLAALLAPDNTMPLDQAAGIYWDYRDLLPAGGEGDALVVRLADRVQAAGLYGRAAELLEYQLRHRARDVAQGPLSVRVATLHILAGRPDRAIAAIRDTERTIFPQNMLWDRARIQAVALDQLGKPEEALAVLQDVPATNGLRAELLWKRRKWDRLVTETAADLPGSGRLSEVQQAIILRYAVALDMLGRSDEVNRLRARYNGGFAGLATAPVFDILTSGAQGLDSESLARAMSAIPAASPAGAFADLLEMAPPYKG